ncbi:hypothetical protein SERLA73DRAFT_172840 [Serpula lacrymans var. lacrymans S7.3]|uniref:isoleucine--tRNA ligase n=2 Tax=Serpula lacrymans var. lacrymans TaxID=341189 RepID=F8QGS8_SERL3|nr:uncharacterized protein SERLADRAFT_445261 [Serpula lacrymans var. lacrymans S7.9]EGN92511.1 hypothetical protein SERLA73DRAFT_172840 [Serpula lacrymans var. lacrymans S7.3]EGO29440.1 hypothetical protein SERLADRAFT_445261 [Serpula lacrymans var. lacrymans S7.9]
MAGCWICSWTLFYRKHWVEARQKNALPPWDQAKVDSKAFSKTLLLPKTNFPLWADPSKREVPFRHRTCDELYRWQWENADGPLFVMHDGPPYANGHLHMGHALNKIIKDIINRYHVLLGDRVHYFPGWDCHGLPIENKALQELRKDALSLPANTIRSVAKATAEREMKTQKDEFEHFGIMADWSTESTYRTLDHDYEIRQLRIFQKMVEKGLIYRHYRPVHYSPSSHSALAEAELTYKDDHVSHSVYVSYSLDLKAEKMSTVLREILAQEPRADLLVWTTTPWTLTANMGIAVHPELTYTVLRRNGAPGNGVLIVAKDRILSLTEVVGPIEVIADIKGSDLVDAPYLPLFSPSGAIVPIPYKIIPASHVTSDSGTGLVHCAPAHGGEDYQAFRTLGLINSHNPNSIICHVDEAGKFTHKVADVVGEEAALTVIGQEVLKDGGKAIVKLLEHTGKLVKVQRIKHRYPYDWKTNEPIIVIATSQWFANLDNIKDDALNALKDVIFFPPASRNRLESFVRSRSEWCISRQRVWGVPIPALYNAHTNQPVLNTESLDHILKVLEEKGVAYWWDGPVEDFLTPQLEAEGGANAWRKGTDTMDVWFDSGTSWSMLKALKEDTPSRQFEADICLEGSDQHRGWFQSQLLTAIGSASEQPSSPYATLITHGMVLDQEGKKMSKSLGNIISPMTIINGGKDKKKEPAYGADVLRLWVATVEYWRDMSIGPTVLSQVAESMRKIRNSARFILGNIGDIDSRKNFQRVEKEDLGLAERYVMHELYKLEKVAHEGYASYNFPKVINSLTNFANLTLSSLYFDITKDCLYADSVHSMKRRAVVTVLENILNSIISVMAPVLPHLAEEIHFHASHTVHGADPARSIFTKKWTSLSPEWEDISAEEDMNHLLRVRSAVLSLLEKARGHKHLKSSLEAEVDIILPGDVAVEKPRVVQLLEREEDFLKTLFIVSDAYVTDEGSLGAESPEWSYVDTMSLPGLDSDIAVRIRPATRSKCPRCWTFTRPESDTLCSRCADVIPP